MIQSIARPDWYNGDQWAKVSEHFMTLLHRDYDLLAGYEPQCGWQLGEFLQDDQLERLALVVLGSNTPATIARCEQLTIVGDGARPCCGSNARTEIWGGYTRDEESGGFAVLGWTCTNCGMEDYR